MYQDSEIHEVKINYTTNMVRMVKVTLEYNTH